jgi:hypothetical protein
MRTVIQKAEQDMGPVKKLLLAPDDSQQLSSLSMSTSSFRGYCDPIPESNVIATLAQLLLRTKGFSKQMLEISRWRKPCVSALMYLDLFAQLFSGEERLDLCPLLQFHYGDPPDQDLFELLSGTLLRFFNFDSSFSFISNCRRDTVAVFSFTSGSIESFLSGELQGARSQSPALFVYVAEADVTITASISVNRRSYSLYAMVTVVAHNSYCVYIRDGEGWLSIENQQIVPFPDQPTDDVYLLGYFDQAREPLDTFRAPLHAPVAPEQLAPAPPEVRALAVPCFLKHNLLQRSEMKFTETTKTFENKEALIAFLRIFPSERRGRYYQSDLSDRFFQNMPSSDSFNSCVIVYEDSSDAFLLSFLQSKRIPIVIQSHTVSRISLTVLFHSKDTVESLFSFCLTLLKQVLHIHISHAADLKLFRTDRFPAVQISTADRFGLAELESTPVVFSFDDQVPQTVMETEPMRLLRAPVSASLTSHTQATVTLLSGLTCLLETEITVRLRAGATGRALIREAARELHGTGELDLFCIAADKITIHRLNYKDSIATLMERGPLRIQRLPEHFCRLVIVSGRFPLKPTGRVYRWPLSSSDLSFSSETMRLKVGTFLGKEVLSVGVVDARGVDQAIGYCEMGDDTRPPYLYAVQL